MFSDTIIGKDFFGRKPILATLNKRFDGFIDGFRQNIALIGRQAIGKTTLIQHFCASINPSRALCVYFDVRHEPVDRMLYRLLAHLLCAVLNHVPTKGLPRLESLIQQMQPRCERLGTCAEDILRHIDQGAHNEAFALIWDAVALVQEELSRPVIICLDEFHRIDEMKLRNPFTVISDKIMVQRDTMYIIISSRPALAKKILSEKLTLLFGNFETITVGGFSQSSSDAYLRHLVQPFSMPEEVRKFLISFTAETPLYLHVVGSHIHRLCLAQQRERITPSVVVQALEQLLFSPKGMLYHYFNHSVNELSVGRSWSNVLAILLALADNCCSPRALSECLQKSTAEISKQMIRLIDTGVIRRCGSFYCFEDKLFKTWLTSVYKVREGACTYTIQPVAQHFRATIEQAMQVFSGQTKQTVPDRVAELFNAFANDLVEIDGKRRRLPAFDDIAVEHLDRSLSMLTARDAKRKWVCLINLDPVFESTVIKSINLTKTLKEKAHQKVFITMNGIDRNARLFAKEEQMWLWGLKDLNLLLELYKQPAIVG